MSTSVSTLSLRAYTPKYKGVQQTTKSEGCGQEKREDGLLYRCCSHKNGNPHKWFLVVDDARPRGRLVETGLSKSDETLLELATRGVASAEELNEALETTWIIQRLHQLQRDGLVEHPSPGAWAITKAGRARARKLEAEA